MIFFSKSFDAKIINVWLWQFTAKFWLVSDLRYRLESTVYSQPKDPWKKKKVNTMFHKFWLVWRAYFRLYENARLKDWQVVLRLWLLKNPSPKQLVKVMILRFSMMYFWAYCWSLALAINKYSRRRDALMYVIYPHRHQNFQSLGYRYCEIKWRRVGICLIQVSRPWASNRYTTHMQEK